jgi:hypothetical protein
VFELQVQLPVLQCRRLLMLEQRLIRYWLLEWQLSLLVLEH